MNDLIEIGFAYHPHGIKGGMILQLISNEETVLKELDSVWLFPANSKSNLSSKGVCYNIKELKFGNKIIMYLEGIEDRTELEKMLPVSLRVSRSLWPELDEGEFYISDLIGLEVFDHHTGELIGTLEDSYDNGAQDIFIVKCKNGKLIELPYIENFFPKIDIEEGRIEMILPEYEDEND